jgi:hypothetical protein
VLFRSMLHDGQTRGVWLVEVTTGRRHLVWASGQAGKARWLPDGRTLVAEVGLDGATGRAGPLPLGLAVLPLPDLTPLRSTSGRTAG